MKKEKYFGLSHRIARWKLDNLVENWLGFRADDSDFFKRLYVLYYYLFDRKYYVAGVKMASNAIKNHASGKGLSCVDDIVRDMIYCLHRFGISFSDYCVYDFIHNHDLAYRESFVADKLRYYYCDLLNSPEIFEILTNKYKCYKHYGQFYKREIVGCFSVEDENCCIEFLLRHQVFIYKPLEEHSGHGVKKYVTNELNPLVFFKQNIENGAFVLEEVIEQGDEIACVHPQSVNSCRVLSFANNGEVSIIGAVWRVGVGNAILDNAGAGGMYAFINPMNGIVETEATNFCGEKFRNHPNSGITFEGFQMPRWSEAVSLIKKMAVTIMGSTLISWDIAYSKRGWVMIEANENGGWRVIQSNKKRGLKKQLFNLMDDYFKTHEPYRLGRIKV